MDSGASVSMTGTKESFIPGTCKKLGTPIPVKLANGSIIYGTRAGRVELASRIVLRQVLLVPELSRNLVFMTAITACDRLDTGYSVLFRYSFCHVLLKISGRVLYSIP